MISNDKDFEGIECIKLFNTIGKLLDEIIREDEDGERIIDALKKFIFDKETKALLESKLEDKFNDYYVDGFNYDCGVCVSGYEYDEFELLQPIKILELYDLKVINFDSKEKYITINLNLHMEFVFECFFFDEENSIWDSVDKEYWRKYYGKMQETHRKVIPIELDLTYSDEKNEISFEIEEIEGSFNLVFNEDSLLRESRKRIDNPNEGWDNYCPDCGCGIISKNDGGNGFCIDCAPNH